MSKYICDIKDTVKKIKSLSDEKRLRTAVLLYYASAPLCVCEIVDSLKESQYNISRCLKSLQDCGIVSSEKKGRWVMYYLSDNIGVAEKMISELSSNFEKYSNIKDDIDRLKKRLSLRRNGMCVIGCKC
ncbi:MAG: winged helix-turn-helix transcriptional regulator [Elusimicrobia bacterium]|nr:winged helix-turn-helix transcriptional regulator [Elusimicrobiota bacterium]